MKKFYASMLVSLVLVSVVNAQQHSAIQSFTVTPPPSVVTIQHPSTIVTTTATTTNPQIKVEQLQVPPQQQLQQLPPQQLQQLPQPIPQQQPRLMMPPATVYSVPAVVQQVVQAPIYAVQCQSYATYSVPVQTQVRYVNVSQRVVSAPVRYASYSSAPVLSSPTTVSTTTTTQQRGLFRKKNITTTNTTIVR